MAKPRAKTALLASLFVNPASARSGEGAVALNLVCLLAVGVREISQYQFGITHFAWSTAQAGWCLYSVSYPV